ncbi:MAG: alpha-1,4-glucan--maltose-1-phosphate maltosyltransferase [Actinomycetota bacterium]
MRRTDRRRRVVIEGVQPEIDCGRFPIKRVIGEDVVVRADMFADGHDVLGGALLFRKADDDAWTEIPMDPLPNDRWRATFSVEELGRYRYTVKAWVDRFATWRRDVAKKAEAGQDVRIDLAVGAAMVDRSARRASGPERTELRTFAKRLRGDRVEALDAAVEPGLASLMTLFGDRRLSTTYERELEVVVDPERARFSSWYEMFPRSAAPEPGRHGTFADVVARLPYVAEMGFDVLYLPPIHPIGRTHRKGPNNVERGDPGDPGSPWAIGSEEGGHNAIHPELGTIEDFERLVRTAREVGIEVAMDIAYQCSPDHPWVREHPSWFRHRPDGSIQYAENPPKKYQDIYPLDFETTDWRNLWEELRGVVEFWIGRGVRIFRVDNPHTKPFAFWEWMIGELKAKHPDLIFLSEAFTRPKVMYRLAKLGFTQSYTYFAWRTTKRELTDYLTELTETDVAEYFRPNLWPNTPDILTAQLQVGGRATFVQRLVLAATLGASYGIYGPAFELMEHRPLTAGSEEYLHSEKYEIRTWNRSDPSSLSELIGRINRIRRTNPALQTNRGLRFHDVDNDALLAYSKRSADGSNVILAVVNLDPEHVQSGWVEMSLDDVAQHPDEAFPVHDLITDAHHRWRRGRNYVELDPGIVPAHILHVRLRARPDVDLEPLP